MRCLNRTIAAGVLVVAGMVKAAPPQVMPDDWLAAMSQSVAAEQAASAPSPTPAPATQPASAPSTQSAASEPAPDVWPPGLLMKGLDLVGAKAPLDSIGLRFWGFTETGFTGNLTNGQHTLAGRVFDYFRPNNLQFNQLRLTVDRPYDTSKPFDIGGRFDLLYGSDAHITKNSFANANDYAFPKNVGEGDSANWLDFLQLYGQLWFKTGKDSGLEVLGGKFVTPFGAEVIDAPGNALYSHSYLFGYAIPFTHTGVKLTYTFDSQLSAYFAVVNGWDDFKDDNSVPSYMAGGCWCGKEQIGGHARNTINFNVITGPEQIDNDDNYRTVVDATGTHWWTDKLSSTLNGDWGTEEDVPNIGRAHWYGLAHYLTYTFNDYVSGTWRTEWFEDDTGARIGVDGDFFENTFGLSITPFPKDAVLKNLSLRPELRYDHSNKAAFGDGHNLLTAAFDVIFKF
jgi:hypothetical protein